MSPAPSTPTLLIFAAMKPPLSICVVAAEPIPSARSGGDRSQIRERAGAALEAQRVVLDGSLAQSLAVGPEAHLYRPRPPRSLLGEALDGALHVARLEIEQRPALLAGIVENGGDRVAAERFG